ncbi:formyltransferase family protein [Afipia sp. GAS231]|uniref:formyltransferase family protein n=1 Tax=Afipia sp. GAS231 TaxID=1882747 RepID=UPI00087D98B3|nr:formyltransferase family protein [Afipia sp. GAS231]SDN36937.1 methionyl-tRNA formyltransferase [Afipia sp. GAS231]
MPLRVHVLCAEGHPVVASLLRWKENQETNKVDVIFRPEDARGGDILFLISCPFIIDDNIRSRYGKTLIVHASDLPIGRGWSPMVWEVIQGAKSITVTLLEAAEKIDSGAIWKKQNFQIADHELYDEINEKLFGITCELMNFAVVNFRTVIPVPQDDRAPSYHRKRTPNDSKIDPDRSIREQFDLLRICDPLRFPAFFELNGQMYDIEIRKRPRS